MQPRTITFLTGILTFYAKNKITFDGDFLRLKCPNVQYFIPLRGLKEDIPFREITAVYTKPGVNILAIPMGILFLFTGFAFLAEDPLWGIAFLAIGFSKVFDSFWLQVIIKTSAETYVLPFSRIYEKEKAFQVKRMIGEIIAKQTKAQ